MYVYLAGPIDSSGNLDGEKQWREFARETLCTRGIPTFNPLAAWGGYCPNRKMAIAVAEIDLKAVESATILLAHYSPSSFGTSVEVGVSIRGGTPVVLWGLELWAATSAILKHPLISQQRGVQEALCETERIWELLKSTSL